MSNTTAERAEQRARKAAREQEDPPRRRIPRVWLLARVRRIRTAQNCIASFLLETRD